MSVPVDDGRCIGCGPDSEIGLRMRFTLEDGGVTSRLAVPERFAGWRGIVHGGVVAMMLDEAMAYAAAASGALGMTAQLELRFRSEVRVGVPLRVRGRVVWRRRDVLALEASIDDAAEVTLASATGRFVSRGPVQPGTRLGFARDAEDVA